MARKLDTLIPYLFLSYEVLCKYPYSNLNKLQNFVGEQFDIHNLRMQFNHFVGGNPVRTNSP
ncbi:MAG: hypothetical protein ABI204_01855 [Ginsengibacter sp.]